MASSPRGRWVVPLLALACAGLIGLFAAAATTRFLADFWPLDASRVGPNLVASAVQWVLIAVVTAVVYPPFRHFIEREINHAHAKLDAHADLLEHIIKSSRGIPSEHGVHVPRGRPR